MRQRGPERWEELALPILGHHTHLEIAGIASTKLVDFLHGNNDALPVMHAAWKSLHAAISEDLPTVRFAAMEPTQRELFIRMLFSALIDADRLDTAEPGGRVNAPSQDTNRLKLLWARFEHHAPRSDRQSATVRRVRNEVYDACLTAASFQPGFFRLRVPTGGGKTRSGWLSRSSMR